MRKEGKCFVDEKHEEKQKATALDMSRYAFFDLGLGGSGLDYRYGRKFQSHL